MRAPWPPETRLGGLAIDLESRRRLRVNGHVRGIHADRLVMDVRECYANCPKYIQKRTIVAEDSALHGGDVATSGSEPLARHHALVRAADTFFVVTVAPEGQADASHRGGSPGFVHVEDDGTLTIPDYAGNSMYSTLGNIARIHAVRCCSGTSTRQPSCTCVARARSTSAKIPVGW